MTRRKNVKIAKSEWSRAGEWHDYAAAVEARLAQGEVEYGDKSFSRAPATLVKEIQEELLDICGWSFILSCRMKRVAATLDSLATTCKHKVVK